MEIVVIAYVLPGVRKVVKAFRRPLRNQPFYVMWRMYGTIFLMVIGWAPVDVGLLFSGHWRDPGTRRETISNFLTFVVLVALGFAFL